MEIVLAVLAILVVVIIARGVVLVQQSEAMVVERLGKFNRVLNSGFHIIVPFFEGIRAMEWRVFHIDIDGKPRITEQKITRIDLRERVLDFPKQHVITRDNVSLYIDALMYFQITDVKRAVYEVVNLPLAIEKLTQTTLRNVVGGMELDECLVSRNKINEELRHVLVDATNKWGVKANRIEVQDIIPPDELRAAMEKQMRAERDRRAKILEAEGGKKAVILSAEGGKEGEIVAAEGAKQAKILMAEGEAVARIKVAEAEAKAIEKIREVLDNKNDATGYLVAIRYIEALQKIAVGGKSKIIFMPYEVSSVLSSLGSMGELLKNAAKISPSSTDSQGSQNGTPEMAIEVEEDEKNGEKP